MPKIPPISFSTLKQKYSQDNLEHIICKTAYFTNNSNVVECVRMLLDMQQKTIKNKYHNF